MAVHADTTGSHFTGLERCGSVWACPVCSAVIRRERAEEIGEAARNWQEQAGGSLVLVTLTMRHKRSDPLREGLDAVLKAWRRMQQGKAWQQFCVKYRIAGTVRAVEVTYGDNGWHPHIHVLVFIESPLAEGAVREWEVTLYRRWAKYVTNYGGGTPSKLRAVDVRPVGDDTRVAAQYLAKPQEHDATPRSTKRHPLGQEMARFDYKTGRLAGLMPFELLDEERGSDDDIWKMRRLWVEYFEATVNRRAFGWSKGLREAVLGGADERTDEQIIEETIVERPEVIVLTGEQYDRYAKNNPASATLLLEMAERGEQGEAASIALGKLERLVTGPRHAARLRRLPNAAGVARGIGVPSSREAAETARCRACGGALATVLASEGAHLLCIA